MKLFKKRELPIIYRRSKSQKVVFAVGFLVMALYAFMLMYPYIYGVVMSLKENGRAFMADPVHIDFPLFFSNYITAFKTLKVGRHTYPVLLFNSVWYSIIGQFLGLATATCSTYVISRYDFKGRNFFYNLVIVVMILPIIGSGPSMYRLFYNLGFVESPLILVGCIGGLCDLILFAYFKGIPKDYSEAAEVDGAGHFRIFYQIMLPQVMGGLSVLFLNGVIGRWNDYSTPLLYLYRSYPTLATGIYIYESEIIYTGNQPIFFAGALIAAIPPVVLFVILQNTLMTKIYIGGLKG